jgi:hypothetical protein
MAFGDRDLESHPWTWGAIALLVAGAAHLGTVLLQFVLLGGLGTAVALSDPNTDWTLLIVLGIWYILPVSGTVLVIGMHFFAARTLRFVGPGPLVWATLGAGVFWPAVRMGLAAISCGFFELPLHLLAALASLGAAVVIAVDPQTKQLFRPRRRPPSPDQPESEPAPTAPERPSEPA